MIVSRLTLATGLCLAVLATAAMAALGPARAAQDDPALDGPAPLAAGSIEREVAVLRWLDKVTARVDTIAVPVNRSVRVQTLEIIVRACLERPPEEPPESAAFLDVSEVKPGEPTAEVFRGWMFASSPALSAMEHPVYDLWVLDCRDQRDERAKDTTSSTDSAR